MTRLEKMTKLEAEALEALIDSKFTEAVGEKCYVSLTLTNKLRIQFGDNSICFDKLLTSISWVEFTGFYSDLQDVIEHCTKCICDNKGSIAKLLWSYDHRSELTDD